LWHARPNVNLFCSEHRKKMSILYMLIGGASLVAILTAYLFASHSAWAPFGVPVVFTVYTLVPIPIFTYFRQIAKLKNTIYGLTDQSVIILRNDRDSWTAKKYSRNALFNFSCHKYLEGGDLIWSPLPQYGLVSKTWHEQSHEEDPYPPGFEFVSFTSIDNVEAVKKLVS
jgi:hypothetical protein